MALIGLEDDLYCAHTPIPVRVTDWSADIARLQIHIGGQPMIDREPILCSDIEGDFIIDLSPWVKQFMPDMRDTGTYTSSAITTPNQQMQLMDIEIYQQDGVHQVQKTFVNCATYEWRLEEDSFVDLKIWECYPISYITPDFLNTVRLIVSGPITASNKRVEFIGGCCPGTYIRWLNRYGYYSYWLFPRHSSSEDEGEEIYRVNNDIFSPLWDGKQKSAGFHANKVITLRDRVSKVYWEMFRDLSTSPEVHMLKDDYIPGADVVASDWIRILQDGAKMETDNANNTAEAEMDFEVPNKYTQTRI